MKIKVKLIGPFMYEAGFSEKDIDEACLLALFVIFPRRYKMSRTHFGKIYATDGLFGLIFPKQLTRKLLEGDFGYVCQRWHYAIPQKE
jgi:hypothetical protein